MTNTTTLSRRNTLAAFASAAVFPIAGKVAQASPVTRHNVDWRAVHSELLTAYRAHTAACNAFDEAVDKAAPVSPIGMAVFVRTPTRNLEGYAWDWQSSVLRRLRNASQAEAYFDGIAQEARAAALEHRWAQGDLEQFLVEGEHRRAAALDKFRQSSPERHAERQAAMAAAVEACRETADREDAIEKLVRAPAADTLEAVQVKLVMLRSKIDEEEFGWAAKYLDEMLTGLATVTGFPEYRAA